MKATAQMAKAPPTTLPAITPTLEEEPLDLDEGDEVAVGEWVVAVSEEDMVGVEAGMVIVAPGPASGVSEKEGWRKTTQVREKKRVFLPPTTRDSFGSQVPKVWDIQSARNDSKMNNERTVTLMSAQ
jgi:hypothetical protein